MPDYSPDNPFAPMLVEGGYSPDNPFAGALNQPTGEMRSGPTGPMPVTEVADDPERGASLLTIARASLPPDTPTQIKRFAASRFPHLPIEAAVKRYGVDRDGNIVYADPETGQLVREVPTIGRGAGILDKFMRARPLLASGAGPAAPGIAAGIAGAVTGPTGGSIPIAGLAAGAADIGRQTLDRWLAGEPLTREGPMGIPIPDADYGNALGQAALGAAGQGASVGLMKLMQRNPLGVAPYDRLKARNPAERAHWDALAAEAKARGVDLSVGQKTGLPSMMAKERALRTLPETTDQFGDFIQKQRLGQVPAAVRQEMDRIAPARSIAEGGEMLRRGGEDVMRGLKQVRTAAASPHYEAAFNSGVEPDIKPALAVIAKEMGKVGDDTPAGKALKKAFSMLTEEVPGPNGPIRVPIADYRKLHSVKESFDDTIGGLFGLNETSAAKRAGRATMEVQSTLRNALRTAHPEYAKGASEYIKATAPINEANATAMRQMLRKDSSAAPLRYAEDLFAASKDVPPAHIARIRQFYANAGKTEEWNAGLRSFVADRLDDALGLNASGEPGGVPGKFVKSVWGTEKQRDVMKAALGDAQLGTSFGKLMEVLQAASRSLPEGSPTAANLAAQNQMMKPSMLARFAGKMTSPGTLLSAGEDIAAGISELRGPAKRIALAQALLSEDGMAKLRRLSMLSPTSQKAIAIVGDILAMSGGRMALRGAGIGVPDPKLPADTEPSAP